MCAQCNVIMTSEFVYITVTFNTLLHQGQRWPLWAQTFNASSEWLSQWLFQIF